MLGGLLAVLSAALFGLSVASVRRGVLTATIAQGLAITVPVGVPIFFVAALAAGQLGALSDVTPGGLVLLAAGGVVHFLVGRYSNYRAIRAMGANMVSPIQPLGLVIALGLAVGLLGEIVTPLRIIGIALVVAGPLIALGSRRRRPRPAGAAAVSPAPDAFRPNYLEGYVFALLSATAYGVSPILVRAALAGAERGIGAGLAGGLVSYAAAALVLAACLVVAGGFRHAAEVPRGPARWFALSGGVVCVSQMARYMALAIAPVTVVAPLVQTASVFRLMFGWLINREHEIFGAWVLAGIAVSLLGAVALTIGTEPVLALVPLPETLAEAARWQWPAR